MKKNLILLILLTTALSAWAAGAKETPQRVIQKNDNEKLNFYFGNNPITDLYMDPAIDWAQYIDFLRVEPTGNTMTQSEDGQPMFIVKADVTNRSFSEYFEKAIEVIETQKPLVDDAEDILNSLLVDYVDNDDPSLETLTGIQFPLIFTDGSWKPYIDNESEFVTNWISLFLPFAVSYEDLESAVLFLVLKTDALQNSGESEEFPAEEEASGIAGDGGAAEAGEETESAAEETGGETAAEEPADVSFSETGFESLNWYEYEEIEFPSADRFPFFDVRMGFYLVHDADETAFNEAMSAAGKNFHAAAVRYLNRLSLEEIHEWSMGNGADCSAAVGFMEMINNEVLAGFFTDAPVKAVPVSWRNVIEIESIPVLDSVAGAP